MNESQGRGGSQPITPPGEQAYHGGLSATQIYGEQGMDPAFADSSRLEAPDSFIPRRSAPAPPSGSRHAPSSSVSGTPNGGYANGSGEFAQGGMVPSRQAPPPPKKSGH
ncbi:hypothetical protein EC988_007644, partial [Linderina pennispora]